MNTRSSKYLKVILSIIVFLAGIAPFSGLATAANSSTYTNVYKKMSYNEQLKLTKFLFPFSDLSEGYNRNNYNEDQIINWLYNGLFDKKFRFNTDLVIDKNKQPFMKDGFQYNPYSEKKINAFLNQTFGIKLAKKSYYSEDNFLNILYKNNYYYIIMPERGGGIGETVAQPHILFSLGKNLYVAKFTLHNFEYETIKDAGFDYKLIFNPLNWNNKFKALSFDNKEGYAIMQKVASGKSYNWKLLKYSEGTITDQQIKKYLQNK
ncbi:hypothetical protein ABGV40_14085 [Paenibacillus amylolyticus]|uniref:hypothetical protein n=1 Tax=Paenibacillus amylolyticus TaxID=1451 RepID=UPI003242A087